MNKKKTALYVNLHNRASLFENFKKFGISKYSMTHMQEAYNSALFHLHEQKYMETSVSNNVSLYYLDIHKIIVNILYSNIIRHPHNF